MVRRAKTEVVEKFQLESCVRGHHIHKEYVDSVVRGSTFCGFAASRSMLRDFSTCFLKIFLG